MNVAIIPPLDTLHVPWACPNCQRHAEACRARTQANAEFIEKAANLSSREREVMLAICAGTAPAATAKRLGISIKTIHTYRARILEKLDLDSNAAIVLACERAGILE